MVDAHNLKGGHNFAPLAHEKINFTEKCTALSHELSTTPGRFAHESSVQDVEVELPEHNLILRRSSKHSLSWLVWKIVYIVFLSVLCKCSHSHQLYTAPGWIGLRKSVSWRVKMERSFKNLKIIQWFACLFGVTKTSRHVMLYFNCQLIGLCDDMMVKGKRWWWAWAEWSGYYYI